jgi:adenylate kinase
MDKRVILVTGTPCVGKTTLSKRLAEKISGQYVNLTEFAEAQNLIVEEDLARDTAIIDEVKMRRKLKQLITKSENNTIIVDGHYAAAVTPKALVSYVFVLRRNPHQLRDLMTQRGYSLQKQSENLSAEILDVCLIEALQKIAPEKICELDISDKSVEETLTTVINILDGKQRCYIGTIDWLGMLEREGQTDQFLNSKS